MQQFNCPSCGAEVAFQSSVSVSTVCPYCRSLIVRHDKDVELIGKMAELPPDISPFQIGTTGRFKNVGFTLVGRMKIGWSEGIWNEWFLVSDEGKKGWLAEAQGFLAISYESDKQLDAETTAAIETHSGKLRDNHAQASAIEAMGMRPTPNTRLGLFVTIEGKRFQISDIKETECIGSEGELPFVAPRGRKTTSIDLLGRDGAFAGIETDDSGKTRVFIGEYAEFNDFGFSHLRDLPGWNIKASAPKPTVKQKKGKPDGGW